MCHECWEPEKPNRGLLYPEGPLILFLLGVILGLLVKLFLKG